MLTNDYSKTLRIMTDVCRVGMSAYLPRMLTPFHLELRNFAD